MKTETENLEEVVRDLNTELYETHGVTDRGFEYSTNGFCQTISFDGILLWNSEDDARLYLEDDEPESVEIYVKKEFNSFIDAMQKIKFKI